MKLIWSGRTYSIKRWLKITFFSSTQVDKIVFSIFLRLNTGTKGKLAARWCPYSAEGPEQIILSDKGSLSLRDNPILKAIWQDGERSPLTLSPSMLQMHYKHAFSWKISFLAQNDWALSVPYLQKDACKHIASTTSVFANQACWFMCQKFMGSSNKSIIRLITMSFRKIQLIQ